MKLSLEKGVANVTVEEICEMADISRSTFFNYFAGRDYAIVGRAVDLPDDASAFAILDSAADDLPRGIFRLLFAGMGHTNVNSEVARLRQRLVEEQPQAARMMMSTLMETTYRLTGIGIAWLTSHPEHARTADPAREVSLAVTLVTGVIVVQMRKWAAAEGDVQATEEDFDLVMEEYRIFLP
ncbi:TetR/AcrR family transcriptional regulator [Leucobacter edaphi]|uniref:TetR/AcrR family transcriptional regulator n=1 Tax=Leucobacter edaphi TaxID=2796472 RepID=UPI0034E30195